MKLIACYGSLKRGYYNHRAVGADAEFMGTDEVRGVMYSNGSYPKLYKKGSLDDYDEPWHDEKQFVEALVRAHTIEVYKINDQAFDFINAMELAAGYEASKIETEWGAATIWYMPHKNFYDRDKWVEKY